MAKFCKFCGASLEEGQVCSCQAAQAAAAPAPEAAPYVAPAAPVATAAPAAAPAAGNALLKKLKEVLLGYLKTPKATAASVAEDPKNLTLAGIFAGINAVAIFLYLWKMLGGIMNLSGEMSAGMMDELDVKYPIFQMLIAAIVMAAVGIAISALVMFVMSKVGKQAVDIKKLFVIEAVNTIYPSLILLVGTVLGFLGLLPQILAVAFLWVVWFLNCASEARDIAGVDLTEKGKNMWIMTVVMLVGYAIAMWAFSKLSLWSIGELSVEGVTLSEAMGEMSGIANILGSLF